MVLAVPAVLAGLRPLAGRGTGTVETVFAGGIGAVLLTAGGATASGGATGGGGGTGTGGGPCVETASGHGFPEAGGGVGGIGRDMLLHH